MADTEPLPSAAAVAPTTTGEEDDQPIAFEEDSNDTWKRPSETDLAQASEERQVKKAKIVDDKATKQRGARMFGFLKGTLRQFDKEGKKTASSDAAKRRTAVEARLHAKLRAEQEAGAKKADRAKTERTLRQDVSRKIDDKILLDNIYKKRQSTAVHLAHFLITSHNFQPSANTSDSIADRRPLSTTHILHAAPTLPDPAPIYYLPYKLTLAQERKIDDQVDAAREKASADKADYEAGEGAEKEKEIDELKRKRDEALAEIEREEREERLLKERAERDKEEETKSKTTAAASSASAMEVEVEKAKEATPVPVAQESAAKEDASMDGNNTPQQQAGDAGEEAIEY